MAGDWIQMQKATAFKPEILRIATDLGCSVGDAFLLCFRFWCWCDDQLVDGNAPGVTPEMLDALLGRAGFCAALLKVDWLQVRSGSLVVPHFDRHLSESAKKRGLSGKRQAEFRSRKSNAHSVTSALPEKRREEKKECVSKETHTNARASPTRFVPPTEVEVRAYCQERRNGIDPEHFVAYYQSRGWRAGSSPVKDWRACIRLWERRQQSDATRQTGGRRHEADASEAGFVGEHDG